MAKARKALAPKPEWTETVYAAADDLRDITAAFREAHPEEWARIHLSPTENGIDHMITVLSRR